MKLYYAVWLLSATTAFAQTSGQTTVPTTTRPGLTISRDATTDRITLTNNMSVQGKVTRRDDRNLYYTKPGDTGGKEQELMLNRIEQIQYADGRVEKLSKKADKPPVQSDNYTATNPPTSSSSSSDDPSFNRLHVTIGPEVAYYGDILNKDKVWLSDSMGLGMKQNVGGSLRVDYLLLRKVGVSLTVGYYGWQLKRNYVRDGTAEFSDTKQLTQIPVQLGVKLYPFGGFYIMPEGGVILLSATIKTSDTHPIPVSESTSATPVVYGGSVGYEIRKKTLLVDVSLRYQLQSINGLGSINTNVSEKLSVASLRIGIGFGSYRK